MDKSILEDSFTINLKATEDRCLSCEAISLVASLHSNPSIENLTEAIIFILDNTKWPVLDE